MTPATPIHVWPLVHDATALKEVLKEKMPAVFEVLDTNETSWGMRFHLLALGPASVIATSRASWIAMCQGQLQYKPVRSLDFFELQALAQAAAAQRLPATLKHLLPSELPNGVVAQRFGVTITREGLIVHAEDYRRSARDIASWRRDFSEGPPFAREGAALPPGDPAASGAVATFATFLAPESSHDRLRSVRNICQLLAAHLAHYSELLPQEAHLSLDPRWAPPRPS